MYKIRCKAICLIINDNKMLVSEDFDTVNKDYLYCPLGGQIEFGELGEDTVKREFIEEIQEEIINVKYLATLENIFVYNGQTGHELVRIYIGELKNKNLYNIDEIYGFEGTSKFKVVWKPLIDFNNNILTLVPKGLSNLLKNYSYTS